MEDVYQGNREADGGNRLGRASGAGDGGFPKLSEEGASDGGFGR